MGTRKARLFVDVEFDEDVTDADSVASALDTLLETALSTQDVLSEQGNPNVGGFCRETETDVDDLAAVVERLASKADSAGLEPEDLDETVHELASSVAADVNNGGLEDQVRYLVEGLGAQHAERQLDELIEEHTERREEEE